MAYISGGRSMSSIDVRDTSFTSDNNRAINVIGSVYQPMHMTYYIKFKIGRIPYSMVLDEFTMLSEGFRSEKNLLNYLYEIHEEKVLKLDLADIYREGNDNKTLQKGE